MEQRLKRAVVVLDVQEDDRAGETLKRLKKIMPSQTDVAPCGAISVWTGWDGINLQVGLGIEHLTELKTFLNCAGTPWEMAMQDGQSTI